MGRTVNHKEVGHALWLVMRRLNELLREYPILVLPIVAVLVVTLSLHSSIYLHSESELNPESTLRFAIQ